MTQGRGKIFLSGPAYMSFICMDMPVGYRLQQGWDSRWPYHLPVCSCNTIPSLSHKKATIHVSWLATATNTLPVAQLTIVLDAQYGRPHHLSGWFNQPVASAYVTYPFPKDLSSSTLFPGDGSSLSLCEPEKHWILIYWKACSQPIPNRFSDAPGRGVNDYPNSPQTHSFIWWAYYVPDALLVVTGTKILVLRELTFQ